MSIVVVPEKYQCEKCSKIYQKVGYFHKHVKDCTGKKTKRKRVEPVSLTTDDQVIERIEEVGPPKVVNILDTMQLTVSGLVKKVKSDAEAVNHVLSNIKTIDENFKNLREDNRELIRKYDDLNQRFSKFTDNYDKFKDTVITSVSGYCLVCWDNESNYAFTPCGHKVVCGTCAAQLMATVGKCPMCRNRVYDMIQIWEGGQKDV